jgi:hypothetical protein
MKIIPEELYAYLRAVTPSVMSIHGLFCPLRRSKLAAYPFPEIMIEMHMTNSDIDLGCVRVNKFTRNL